VGQFRLRLLKTSLALAVTNSVLHARLSLHSAREFLNHFGPEGEESFKGEFCLGEISTISVRE